LESRRFGRLEIRPDCVVNFPGGLLGFEEYQEYVRVAPETLAPLTFLVACDNPEIAFPVLPASSCMEGYAPALPPEALDVIGARQDERLEILAVVTLAPETGTLHANLRGPLLINPATGLGCQVVLHDDQYSLRHLLNGG
jgi:flagellar assembly factor FliW